MTQPHLGLRLGITSKGFTLVRLSGQAPLLTHPCRFSSIEPPFENAMKKGDRHHVNFDANVDQCNMTQIFVTYYPCGAEWRVEQRPNWRGTDSQIPGFKGRERSLPEPRDVNE